MKCPECDMGLSLISIGKEWTNFYVEANGEIDWSSGKSEDNCEELDRMLYCANCGTEYEARMIDDSTVEIGKKYEHPQSVMEYRLLEKAKKYLPNASDFYICWLDEIIKAGHLSYSLMRYIKKSLDVRIKEANRRDM